MELIANSKTAKKLAVERKEINYKNCSGDHNDGPKDARWYYLLKDVHR